MYAGACAVMRGWRRALKSGAGAGEGSGSGMEG